jgi:hypothetical protein
MFNRMMVRLRTCMVIWGLALYVAAGTFSEVKAAEWQWSVTIPSIVSVETETHPQAFLWIPTDCRQVKAVVVGQHNMCEETLFENSLFREKMREAGIALVWITPILDFPWNVANGCNDALLTALDDLADISGYTELRFAPIVPLGHSAMATFPWNFAAWNPERTLAVVSYHGDAPRTNLTGYGGANLEWGRNRNIDGIPGLMIEGEYEWWEARVNPALAFRMMYPESCISFLCDAGRGHFDVADRTAEYVGLFLKKAVEWRISEVVDENQSVVMKKVNPHDGWLAERWRNGKENAPEEVRTARLTKQPRRAKPAPYGQYKGDRHDAFWYFDREIAELTEAFYRQDHDLLPQYVSFMQAGELIPYNPKSHVTLSARFLPEADGVTFHMKAAYTDSLRTSLTGQHAVSVPRISRICGPVKQLDDTTFVLNFYRMGMNNKKRTASITLVASADGDRHYKECVQELGLNVPYPLTEGKRQHILFPGLEDVEAGTASLPLQAVSDCALPVYYYVKEGPAEIAEGKVVFTPIPPRSKFPLKVTVVAWQYGFQGKVQTAEPVERSFYIKSK